jgi:hypothetical protein
VRRLDDRLPVVEVTGGADLAARSAPWAICSGADPARRLARRRCQGINSGVILP